MNDVPLRPAPSLMQQRPFVLFWLARLVRDHGLPDDGPG